MPNKTIRKHFCKGGGVLAGLAGFALLLATGPVNADTPAQCETAIMNLQNALNSLTPTTPFDCEGVDIGGRHPEKTCDSLNSKLIGALEKLDAAKFNKVVPKLNDFQTKVDQLAGPEGDNPKDKLTEADAALIDANTAIGACDELN